MSAVSGVDSTTTTYASTASASSSGSVLGKDDFLRLLVEQLKAQDPLNPKDPSEFTAQLAQFSSLEQLMNLGTALDSLTSVSASMNNISAAGFLGHEAVASGSRIAMSSGEASGIQYTLGADAASVRATIYDDSGNAVRVVDLGPRPSGSNDFQWDGATTTGATAPDGLYSIEIEAAGSDGSTIQVDTYMQGRITGISYDNGITMLEMDGQRVPIADILSVQLSDSEE